MVRPEPVQRLVVQRGPRQGRRIVFAVGLRKMPTESIAMFLRPDFHGTRPFAGTHSKPLISFCPFPLEPTKAQLGNFYALGPKALCVAAQLGRSCANLGSCDNRFK